MTEKTNPCEGVFPGQKFQDINLTTSTTGLTKREFFAALAMVGMLAHWDIPTKDIAESAVRAADYLIEALNAQ